MNWGNAIVASIALLIAIGTVWWSLLMRRKGDSKWWAYLLSLPIILYIAVATALGHPPAGRG